MTRSSGSRFSNVVRSHASERGSSSAVDGLLPGSTLRLAAGEAIGLGEIVYQQANKSAYRASANNPNTREILGISAQSVLPGALFEVVYRGTLSNPAWSWIAGQVIYAGMNGALTQTRPITGYLAEVGHAVSADTILIDVERHPRKVYLKALTGFSASIPTTESGIAYPSVAVLNGAGDEVGVVVNITTVTVTINSNIALDGHTAVLH